MQNDPELGIFDLQWLENTNFDQKSRVSIRYLKLCNSLNFRIKIALNFEFRIETTEKYEFLNENGRFLSSVSPLMMCFDV